MTYSKDDVEQAFSILENALKDIDARNMKRVQNISVTTKIQDLVKLKQKREEAVKSLKVGLYEAMH